LNDNNGFKRVFINYSKTDEAQKAIQNLNSSRPFGGVKALNVKFWQSKEERDKEENRQKTEEIERMMRNLLNLSKP